MASPNHSQAKQRKSSCHFSMVSSEQGRQFSLLPWGTISHWNPKIIHIASPTWNVAWIAMSKNVICTNLIIVSLHKSRDKLPHRKYKQMVYLLCYTSCIFPGTIKKRTSSGMSFHCMSDVGEAFSEESSLPCSCQDNESSGSGAPLGSPPLADTNCCGFQHYLVGWGRAPACEGRQAEGCGGCCDDCCCCMRSCRLRAFRILICNFLSTRALLCVLELAPCRASLSLAKMQKKI